MRAFLLAAVVLGATVIPQTPEQLSDRSERIVRGQVTAQHTAEGAPAGLYTFTTLKVDEVLKGEKSASLVIRQVGGTVGARTLELPGDATLKVGEEVLVFVNCTGRAGFCALVGLAQGKYTLTGKGQEMQATRDFAETTFVKGAPLSPGPERYSALAKRIRAHVRGAK